MFERFARGNGRQTQGPRGTGLGLAIVRAVAEAHSGSVRVESPPGRGSSFRITIPGFRPAPSDPVMTVPAATTAGVSGNGAFQRSNR